MSTTNGSPQTLAELVDHEALGYHAWNTVEGNFLARQMERLAQLIRWTEAKTPQDYEDRIERIEFDARANEYDRGYSDGAVTAYCPR